MRFLNVLKLPEAKGHSPPGTDPPLLEDLFAGSRASPYAILAEEKEAVIAYALEHQVGTLRFIANFAPASRTW